LLVILTGLLLRTVFQRSEFEQFAKALCKFTPKFLCEIQLYNTKDDKQKLYNIDTRPRVARSRMESSPWSAILKRSRSLPPSRIPLLKSSLKSEILYFDNYGNKTVTNLGNVFQVLQTRLTLVNKTCSISFILRQRKWTLLTCEKQMRVMNIFEINQTYGIFKTF